jgi:Beta protein
VFDHRHYVPALKARQGELGALETLSVAARKRLTPIIELQEVPFDHGSKTYKLSVPEHIIKTMKSVRKAWPGDARLFLDGAELADSPIAHTAAVVTKAHGMARTLKIMAVPVTGLEKTTGHDEAVRGVIGTDGLGVCLRLGVADLSTPDMLSVSLANRLNALKVSAGQTDLIVDFRGITKAQVPLITWSAKMLLSSLPTPAAWRSLTVLCTTFPETLGGVVKPGSEGMIARGDWTLWQDIMADNVSLPRKPAFGDYGIQHPYLPDLAPQILNETMIPAIRYTCLDSWLIIRGHRFKTHGHEQFHELAAKLKARTEYQGPSFSWGDNYIERCALKTAKTGSQGTWRRVGTSHHLEFVVKQLSTLFGA